MAGGIRPSASCGRYSLYITFHSSLMMLVEQGKLDLDRDVNEYLPFTVSHPVYPESPITTRQLLTHSSAIIDRDAIPPGTARQYCNVGYRLAGYLVEVLSGKPWRLLKTATINSKPSHGLIEALKMATPWSGTAAAIPG